ncbi:squalene--hopene cyclase [Brevibacillus sp. H7]|uniref:squalene--hopene cyclase n=1 Tax=Brevibacillus sp. H7 TaxID=3349138 RepID=UPI00380C9314
MIDRVDVEINRIIQVMQKSQSLDGAWKLFHDEEEGNLSATVEAYYALLFSGYCRNNDARMQAAKRFILSKGGLSHSSLLTKVMLASTGQYPWPKHVLLPIEMMLLPPWFPVHFFDFAGYARVHIAPLLVVSDRKFVRRIPGTPDISDLRNSRTSILQSAEARSFHKRIVDGIRSLPYLPAVMHRQALRMAERFMLDRLEADGTLYSYFTSTFLMIFALQALGYASNHPVITRAIAGMKAMTCPANGHVQNATATVWNTALLAHALLSVGVQPSNPMVKKAGRYLLSRQQDRYGDWALKDPFVLPGGWGFSDVNTINPDVDDTTAALRVMNRLREEDPAYRQSWKRGLQWLLSMQNDDGGWPAFEKNTDKKILSLLPMEGADAVSTDPSTADLTGRTLEFLGNHAGFTLPHPNVERAVHWILRNQQMDGSWYGRWGISYLYGTWSAVTGMRAVGVAPEHQAVQKAVQWVQRIQNEDGGWGESCKSDILKRYVPLGGSTLSQTAWAVDTLIAVSPEPTTAIERGIQYLLANGKTEDWTVSYPTGAGLPGGFYFHYHSYRYIWPLLAFAHYKRKYFP